MKIQFSNILSLISIISITKSIKEGIFFPKKKKIIVLSDLTFEEAIKEYKYIIISAYAEWCSTCKNIENELNKVANFFEKDKDSPEIAFAKILGSSNYGYMKRYNLQGYPSLILYKEGNVYTHINDLFSDEKLIPLIRKMIIPFYQPIRDEETFNYLIKNTGLSKVIAYFGNDNNALEVLKKTSLSYDKYTFCQILNKDLYKKYNASNNDIILYKNFDELNITFKKNITFENIEKFIDKYGHKLLKPFNYLNIRNTFLNRRSLLLFISKVKTRREELKYINEREKICKKIREKVQCITGIYDKKSLDKLRENVPVQGSPYKSARRNELEFAQTREKAKYYINLMDSFNLNDNDNEIFLIDLNNIDTFAFKIENNENKIIEFVNNWYFNKLINQSKIKVDNIIPNKIIYSNMENFNNDVINNKYNVVVQFFLPWNGNCKKFFYVYQKLSNYFSKIRFVRIDVNKNNNTGFEITEFPTLYFFDKKNKNQPLLYKGEYNYNELLRFIKDIYEQ